MRVFIKINFLFIFTLCVVTAHAARTAKDADCAPVIVPQTIERLVLDLNPMNLNCWDKSNYSVVGNDEKSRLDEQKNICTCLNSHRNPDIQLELSFAASRERLRKDLSSNLSAQLGRRVIPEKAEDVVRNFKESVQRTQRNLREQMDGMLFQSSVISNNIDFIAEFNSKSELGNIMRTVREKYPLMRQGVVTQAKTKLAEANTSGGWLDRIKDKKEIEDRVVSALNDMKIPDKPTEGLLGGQLSDGVCVSAQDFLAYKQAPTEKALNDFILNSSFKEEDWDYNRLRQKLERLTARPLHVKRHDAEEINSVKARMRFLRMNPMVMNLFKSDSSNNGSFFSFANLSASEREIWEKHPGWGQLPSMKENLFGILKNVASNTRCDDQKKTCYVDSTQSNKIADYRSSLEKFFSDPNAKSMTMMEASKSSFLQVSGLTDGQAFTYPDKTKSLARVNEYFATKYPNYTPPEECLNSGSPDFKDCTRTYAAYCEEVSEASENLNEDLSSNENLGMELGLPENIFNPDLKTNREYNEFNDKICNQERMSVPAGRFSTFTKFRDEFCRSQSRDSGCGASATPAGIAAIRTKFLEQYPAQRGEDSEITAMETRAFNEYVKKNAVETLKQEQIANVVQRSSSATRPSEQFMQYSNSIRSGSDAVASSAPISSRQITPSNVSRTISNVGYNEVASVPADIPAFQAASIIAPQPNFLSSVSNQTTISEDDREKIRSLAEEEIARVRKESAGSVDQIQRDALESRVKTMEQLLAQKAENELKYQQLIEQLNKKLDSGIAPTTIANQSAPEDNKKTRAQSQVNQNSFTVDNENQNRAPASINENVNSTYGATGTSGGMASLGGSSGTKAMSGGRGASSFNSALLEAQESKAGKVQKSADGSIIVASDANSPSLQAMGSAASAVSDYSLSVPAADYAGFEAQNMETLKRYQEKLLTSMESNQPVRVFVKAANKEPLEFFVVKDGERLFFKPVRKTGATLEALKEVVKKKP